MQLQTLGCFQTLVRLVGAPTAPPAVSDVALWLLQDIVTAHTANHEAVEVRETDEAPDRTVVEVFRSGYARGDRILRPAQVAVARAAQTET